MVGIANAYAFVWIAQYYTGGLTAHVVVGLFEMYILSNKANMRLYTDYKYKPVRLVAEASTTGDPATECFCLVSGVPGLFLPCSEVLHPAASCFSAAAVPLVNLLPSVRVRSYVCALLVCLSSLPKHTGPETPIADTVQGTARTS